MELKLIRNSKAWYVIRWSNKVYDKAIKIDPQDSIAWYNKGTLSK
jgi:hypothetical protein